jgi:hypothetical protein
MAARRCRRLLDGFQYIDERAGLTTKTPEKGLIKSAMR